MLHEIDLKVLDDLLNENPATLLRKGDSKLQTLAQFLLRYVILCKPKELLVNELHCNQAKAYEEDPATGKQDKFDCALDYYSPVIVAMVWMQYDNHHGEWKNRKMNVISSQTESAKCRSKFTSNNKGRKAGGCYVES